MSEYIDIHRYKKVLTRCEQDLELIIQGKDYDTPWKGLSARNAKMILDFERTCALMENVRIPTRLKYIDKLVHFARDFLKMDFDAPNKEDMKKAIREVDMAQKKGKPRYTAHSRKTIRTTVKKFFRWLHYGDAYNSPENRLNYPPIVSWLNTQVNKHDYNKVRASDLLTEDEVISLINNANNARNRAYIAMLYELGARVGEHGGLRLKHLTKTEHGYNIDLFGKTLDRTPALVLAAPYLTNWLNVHPARNDPTAPLWTLTNHHGTIRPAMYGPPTINIERTPEFKDFKYICPSRLCFC